MSDSDRLQKSLRTNGHSRLASEYEAPSRSSQDNNGRRKPPETRQVMKWAVLLGSSMVAACVAASGLALLTTLLIVRSVAPPIASYEKELYFDYTQPEAVAIASFLKPSSKSQVSAARFLQPGTSVNVWLDLITPDSTDDGNGDMFQVKAELVSADGRVAASASRPCTVTYRSPLVRMLRTLAKLPVTLPGWHREQQVLRVPLFQRYRERADVPFAEFKATLQARSKGELPRLYTADVHVDLNLGVLRRLLFWVRPGDFMMLNLVLVGLAALLGGGLSSLGLLAVWVLSASSIGGGEGGGAQGGKAGKLGRRQSGEDEASSEGGWSEISTGELEASEAEKDRELAAGGAGGSEVAPLESSLMTPLTAQALKRWDARSTSQQSLVSSEGTTLYDDSVSRHSKKLK